MSRGIGIPLLIMVVGAGAIGYLASQDKAVKVNDQGVPVQASTPVLAPPTPSPEKAAPGRNNLPPGAVIRSLDKINAAAKAVGCDELRPDDPAGKLIDVAECLGAKAQAGRR
jgi:hypothetical protein